MEESSTVYAQYSVAGGKYILCKFPVSETELAIYKRQPDTFFEAVLPVAKALKTPLDCFDLVAETFLNAPKERLLELIANWSDFAQLAGIPRKQLAERYCDRLAQSMWRRRQESKLNENKASQGADYA